MSNETGNVETNVETLDINIDEIFDGAPSAEGITVPQQKNSIFQKPETTDFSFTQPTTKTTEETQEETTSEAEDKKGDVETAQETFEQAQEVFESLDESIDPEAEAIDEPKKGRRRINGISDVFDKLIKSDKIIPFDDDKSLEDYTAKDWEELIDANLEERANQVRRETPKQFFESLPNELQIAARYVAEGGTDMKG